MRMALQMKLEADGLACRRGERVLFRDLRFAVSSGAMIEVTGANGAGKSSLLRMLAGLMQAEAGTITYSLNGKALTKDDEPSHNLIHYLGHFDGLKTQMTPLENLGFAARYFGGQTSAETALARVGLSAQAELPVGYLSAGQRRRLSLARCLVLARPLWLLDEPASALDDAGKKLVGEIIAAHVAGGGIVLAATHERLVPHAEELRIA